MTPKERYAEFLKSEFWIGLSRRKRRMVGRCERCGGRRYLQAHHRFYREDWFQTELGDLEVLCRRCHAKHHGISGPEKRSKASRKLDDALARYREGRPTTKDLNVLRSQNRITRDEFKRFDHLFRKLKAAVETKAKKRDARWHPGMYEGMTKEQALQQVGKSR